MAHLLLTPVLNVAMKAVVDSAGAVLWYTGAGVWWLGKRAIYGYQPSAEELQAQREREREERDAKRELKREQERLDRELEREEQRKERELLEKLLQQQSEMLNKTNFILQNNSSNNTSELKST
jgi:uncharacterized membrane protein YfbV (UPF0208 family)